MAERITERGANCRQERFGTKEHGPQFPMSPTTTHLGDSGAGRQSRRGALHIRGKARLLGQLCVSTRSERVLGESSFVVIVVVVKAF